MGRNIGVKTGQRNTHLVSEIHMVHFYNCREQRAGNKFYLCDKHLDNYPNLPKHYLVVDLGLVHGIEKTACHLCNPKGGPDECRRYKIT